MDQSGDTSSNPCTTKPEDNRTAILEELEYMTRLLKIFRRPEAIPKGIRSSLNRHYKTLGDLLERLMKPYETDSLSVPEGQKPDGV